MCTCADPNHDELQDLKTAAFVIAVGAIGFLGVYAFIVIQLYKWWSQ